MIHTQHSNTDLVTAPCHGRPGFGIPPVDPVGQPIHDGMERRDLVRWRTGLAALDTIDDGAQ